MAYKTFEDFKEEVRKDNIDKYEKKKNKINKTSQEKRDKLNSDYKYEIDENEKSFIDDYRENEVQKLINEREVAENMANLGLGDSGFNRVNTQAAENAYTVGKANIDRRKQERVDYLAKRLDEELKELDKDTASAIEELDEDFNEQVEENALKQYNSYIEDIQKYSSKNSTKASGNSNNTVTPINNVIKTKDDIMSEIYSEMMKSDADIDFNPKNFSGSYTNPQIDALLKKSGISSNEWKKYFLSNYGINTDINKDGKFDVKDLVRAKNNGYDTAVIDYIKSGLLEVD